MQRIALVMIARDESRCIGRCLRSASPWVDEMWVLDTGSTDDTMALARREGAMVAQLAWQDDFSAARNAALALTGADWCLVLDADEWIVGDGSGLARWRERSEPALGLVQVTSLAQDARGQPQQAPSWMPRLLPHGVRYAGRIHEQPVSSLPRERVSLTVMHDGYLPGQRQAKQGRNLHLLEISLAESPDDAYLRYQLGKELGLGDRPCEAAAPLLAALQACPRTAAWRHDLVLRTLFTLKCAGRHAEAVQLAEAEMPHWAHSPDFYFTLGDLLLDWAASEPTRGAELLPMIEACWLRALEIGERPDLPDSVSGRGSWLAAHNLAVFHASLGQATQARQWQERAAAMRAC